MAADGTTSTSSVTLFIHARRWAPDTATIPYQPRQHTVASKNTEKETAASGPTGAVPGAQLVSWITGISAINPFAPIQVDAGHDFFLIQLQQFGVGANVAHGKGRAGQAVVCVLLERLMAWQLLRLRCIAPPLATLSPHFLTGRRQLQAERTNQRATACDSVDGRTRRMTASSSFIWFVVRAAVAFPAKRKRAGKYALFSSLLLALLLALFLIRRRHPRLSCSGAPVPCLSTSSTLTFTRSPSLSTSLT